MIVSLAVEVMVQMAMVRNLFTNLNQSILMVSITGTNGGQGSGDLLSNVSLETFDLTPGAGGESCGPQFGVYGGGGGGGVLVKGKVGPFLRWKCFGVF